MASSKEQLSPCVRLLEPHSLFTNSFSWVSEGPSSLKEAQTVKKNIFVDVRLLGHHPRALNVNELMRC